MSAPRVRVTVDVARLLRVFLEEDPLQPRYGYDLMRITGFPSGKMYPMLARLLAARWLEKERETVDPATEGRPVRHFYRVNPEMLATVRNELAAVTQHFTHSSPTALRPGLSHA